MPNLPSPERWRAVVLGFATFAVLAVVLSPFFWAIYRAMAFNTMPRDDYAPYVLWLLGQPGGFLPGSPYGYRILSAVAAIPFDLVLPPLRLSNLPAAVSLPYLRATAAIAALSYCSLLGTGFLVALYARRLGLRAGEAAFAGAILFVLAWHSQVYAIDPFTILVVTALLALLRRPRVFAAAVLLSIVADEKACMVMVIWLTIRCLLGGKPALRLPWLASIGAFGAYFLLIALVHLPGNAYQLTPSHYLPNILANLAVDLSGRGLVLNVLPTAILGAVALAGWPALPLGPSSRLDILVIPGLVLLALTVTTDFQIGRIVMHAAPLFVVPAAAATGFWYARAQRFLHSVPRP